MRAPLATDLEELVERWKGGESKKKKIPKKW